MNIEQKLDKEISIFVKTSSKNKNVGAAKNLTYSEFLSDKMLMIAAIRQGVPYTLFSLLTLRSRICRGTTLRK
jgi:hypothetical protein